MARPRSKTNQVLLAVGLVSSVCAAIGTYLYFSTNTASVPSLRKRRKIMVSGASAQEVLDFLPADAVEHDEIYVTILCENDDYDAVVEGVRARTSYLLRHEKCAGVIHIARHISPDIVIFTPGIANQIAVHEVKDWVGQVIVLGTSGQAGENNQKVRNVASDMSYDQLV